MDGISKYWVTDSSSVVQKKQIVEKAATTGMHFTSEVDVSTLDDLVQGTIMFPRKAEKVTADIQDWLKDHPNDVSDECTLHV